MCGFVSRRGLVMRDYFAMKIIGTYNTHHGSFCARRSAGMGLS